MEEDEERKVEDYTVEELQEALVNLHSKYKKFTGEAKKTVRANYEYIAKIYDKICPNIVKLKL